MHIRNRTTGYHRIVQSLHRNPRRRMTVGLAAVLLALLLAGMAVDDLHAQATDPPPPQPALDADTCAEANIFYGAVPPGGEDARVLVFVHGLAGLAQDWWTDATIAGFNDMYLTAYQFGFRTAFVNVNVINPDGACMAERRPALDMLRNGRFLADQIETIVEHYNVRQVDIVAHSKGGIDAQTATVWFGGWRYVRNIITVGTPHQGSILADLLWSPEGEPLGELLGQRDLGTFSLRTPLMKLFRFVTDSSRLGENVEYHSGAGNFWNTPNSLYRILGAWLQAQPNGGPNDGVIVVSSTELAYADRLYIRPWNHSEITLGHNTFPYVLQTLLADITPAGDVAVTGPDIGTIGRAYDFAAILPPRATQPVTYTWQATGQPPVVRSAGTNDTVSFAWDQPGPKQVVVTAANIAGSSTATHTLEINEVTAPAQLAIAGPRIGNATVAYQFTALLPVTTTLPVTYTWQATGQPSVTRSTNSATDIMSFNWQTQGPKAIRVLVENEAGVATAITNVNITAPPPPLSQHRRYVPMIQAGSIIGMRAAQVADSSGTGSNSIVRGGTLATSATAQFPVEPEARAFEVALFTTDPAATATLVGPDGRRIALAPVPNASHDMFAGASLLAGAVDAPAPGEWQVEMQSTQTTAYLALVTLDSTLNVQLAGLGTPLGLPEQLLELEVSSQSEAGETSVDAVTLTVSGGVETAGEVTAQMVYTGPSLDYTIPAELGLYNLSIRASGTTVNGYGFERAFVHPLAVVLPDQVLVDLNRTDFEILFGGYLP